MDRDNVCFVKWYANCLVQLIKSHKLMVKMAPDAIGYVGKVTVTALFTLP